MKTEKLYYTDKGVSKEKLVDHGAGELVGQRNDSVRFDSSRLFGRNRVDECGHTIEHLSLHGSVPAAANAHIPHRPERKASDQTPGLALRSRDPENAVRR